jgi:hypothetical protein
MCWYTIENGVLTVETEGFNDEACLGPSEMWVIIRSTVVVEVGRDGTRVRELLLWGEA